MGITGIRFDGILKENLFGKIGRWNSGKIINCKMSVPHTRPFNRSEPGGVIFSKPLKSLISKSTLVVSSRQSDSRGWGQLRQGIQPDRRLQCRIPLVVGASAKQMPAFQKARNT